MEREIDLRPYFQVLAKYWLTLLIAAVGLAVIVALFGTTSRLPSESATVLVVGSNQQLRLEPRFITDDTSQLSTAANQRSAIIALANSVTVEEQVRSELPAELNARFQTPGSLAQQIQVRITGDLIRLTMADPNPATARTIVTAWADAYVEVVNQIYNQSATLVSDVQTELDAAQQRYETTQTELNTFISTSRQTELEQRQSDLKGFLATAQQATFELYQDFAERVRDLDIALSDARTLRQQITSGQPTNLADGLAILAIRARIAGGSELPIDLRFDDPTAFSEAVNVADLDRLIQIVEQRRADLSKQTQQIAQDLAEGKPIAGSISQEQRELYLTELKTAARELEEQTAQRRLLEQRRDLAREALAVLQRKLDEQQIAAGTTRTELRNIGVYTDPAPGATSVVTLAGLGTVVGLLLGIVIAFVRNALAQRRQAGQPRPQTDPLPVQTAETSPAKQDQSVLRS
jgi:capsular polysaccharide biosynthesis protein